MNWWQVRVDFVKNVLKQRPLLFALLSLPYFLYFIGTQVYIYGNPFQFFNTFPGWYTYSYTFLSLVSSILLGILVTLIVAKFHEVRAKSLGLGATGVFIGALAAGCPGCFFGLFPIVAGMLGIGGTLAILPFNGLEFLLLTVLLLVGSILLLAKEVDLTCDVKKPKK